MLLQKTDLIAGLPAPLARDVIRRFAAGDEMHTECARLPLEKAAIDDVGDVVRRLADAGYLEHGRKLVGGGDTWRLTLAGSSLAMARIGKGISRTKAATLLTELIERAKSLNANKSEMFTVTRLRVFGSYLDDNAAVLGDLDVEIVLERRVGVRDLEAYGRKADRSFNTYLEQLTWAEREFKMKLRGRSTFIHLTDQNVDEIPADSRVVFEP